MNLVLKKIFLDMKNTEELFNVALGL